MRIHRRKLHTFAVKLILQYRLTDFINLVIRGNTTWSKLNYEYVSADEIRKEKKGIVLISKRSPLAFLFSCSSLAFRFASLSRKGPLSFDWRIVQLQVQLRSIVLRLKEVATPFRKRMVELCVCVFFFTFTVWCIVLFRLHPRRVSF